jgi:hypothetical protein
MKKILTKFAIIKLSCCGSHFDDDRVDRPAPIQALLRRLVMLILVAAIDQSKNVPKMVVHCFLHPSEENLSGNY